MNLEMGKLEARFTLSPSRCCHGSSVRLDPPGFGMACGLRSQGEPTAKAKMALNLRGCPPPETAFSRPPTTYE